MITIPSGLITLYNDAIDSIIEFNGVPIVLVYPPKKIICTNCIQTNLIGGISTNRYKSGGPIPFLDGQICPLCQGQGYKLNEVTEVINVLIYWSPKDFQNTNTKFDIVDGRIQTKSYISDLPKINKCIEMRANSNINSYITYKYRRISEPVPHGFKSDRYILTFWDRI